MLFRHRAHNIRKDMCASGSYLRCRICCIGEYRREIRRPHAPSRSLDGHHHTCCIDSRKPLLSHKTAFRSYQNHPLSLKQTGYTNQRPSPASRLAILHQHTDLRFDNLAPAAAMALDHRCWLGHRTNTLAHLLRRSIRGWCALNEMKARRISHCRTSEGCR